MGRSDTSRLDDSNQTDTWLFLVCRLVYSMLDRFLGTHQKIFFSPSAICWSLLTVCLHRDQKLDVQIIWWQYAAPSLLMTVSQHPRLASAASLPNRRLHPSSAPNI